MAENYGKSWIVMLAVVGFVATACTPDEPLPAKYRGASTLSMSDYGSLPQLPSTNLAGEGDSDEFEGLIDAYGRAPRGKVLVNTELTVGGSKDGSCAIPAGTSLYLIARRRIGLEYFFIAQMERPCQVGGKPLGEGYVPAANVLFQPPADIAQTNTPGPVGGNSPVGETLNGTVPVAETHSQPAEQAQSESQSEQSQSVTTSQTPARCEFMQIEFADESYQRKKINGNGFNIFGGIFNRKNDERSQTWIPGDMFRNQRDRLALVVKAEGDRFRITVKQSEVFSDNDGGDGEEMPARELEVSLLTRDGDGYQIPFEKFIDHNSWRGVGFEITLEALSGSRVSGQRCSVRARLASPVVLEFSGADSLSHVEPKDSSVTYDLDGDGVREHTGWIRSTSAAFLALDRNGNGKIDDGRELFGDYTPRVGGGRFSHGFAALAAFDSDGNSRIDQQDPVFVHLRLWFDENGDGYTQPKELKTLHEMGVTAISTVATENSHPADRSPLKNDVRFRSRFFGPEQCGQHGCHSFDIFFGSWSQRIHAGS